MILGAFVGVQSAILIKSFQVVLKVYLKKDQTYKTLAITNATTTAEILRKLTKKLGLSESLATSLELYECESNGKGKFNALRFKTSIENAHGASNCLQRSAKCKSLNVQAGCN